MRVRSVVSFETRIIIISVIPRERRSRKSHDYWEIVYFQRNLSLFPRTRFFVPVSRMQVIWRWVQGWVLSTVWWKVGLISNYRDRESRKESFWDLGGAGHICGTSLYRILALVLTLLNTIAKNHSKMHWFAKFSKVELFYGCMLSSQLINPRILFNFDLKARGQVVRGRVVFPAPPPPLLEAGLRNYNHFFWCRKFRN